MRRFAAARKYKFSGGGGRSATHHTGLAPAPPVRNLPIMKVETSGATILRRENIGFSLILLINWAAEIIRLPHLLYGDPVDFNWRRVLLRSVVIIIVWAWVYFATRGLIKRLHRLEEFMLVCSWCRKVGQEGRWLTMEQYFGSNFDTQTSHGICPECSQKTRDRLAQQIAEATAKDQGVLPDPICQPVRGEERPVTRV